MAAPAALPATAVWEFRTSGNAANGGIFDPSAVNAGTDYSQQDAPQLALTDCTMATGGTTLHSDTGGFTAAMIGNWCHLSGTHFTTGRRKITAVADGNNCTLCSDATDGTNGSSGVCNVGGAIYEVNGTNLVALGLLVTAGNTIYVLGPGTYTITTAAVTAGTAGTDVAPVNVIGVTAGRVAATGDNRPLIDGGAYQITWAVGWHRYNLRGTGTAADVWYETNTAYGTIYNCRITNTSTTAGTRDAVRTHITKLIACEISAVTGTGVVTAAADIRYCWIHDCVTGVNCNSVISVVGCLIEQCVAGIAQAANGVLLTGSTFAGCGTAVTATTASFATVLDNLLAYNTIGANWTSGTNYRRNLLDYNNWYGNGADVSNVTKGSHDTAYDPAFQGLHSWTDLVVSAGSNVVVTSVTGGFSTYYQAGDYIWIDAAAGWTSNAYRIATVDSATQLTLATSPAAVNTTGGIARTIRTAVGVSDCRLGAASDCRGAGLGLTLGTGAASTVEQGAWMAGADAGTTGMPAIVGSALIR